MSASAHRSSALFRLIISTLLLAAAVLVFMNRQELLDRFNVWRFTPSSAVAQIGQNASFSERGTFMYYASLPELLERDAFNKACRSVATEQTAVLGCYSANRIYLFDIDNEKLAGVKEVTAAHEMLHAVYQRMSEPEKNRVNALLETQTLGDDEERIANLMAEYEKTEPGQRFNELHSILGSEVSELSPELEAYYAKYFDDRKKVVAYADSYQMVFNELQSRQDQLVSELEQLADTIDGDSAVYRRNLQVLERDIRAFNEEASSGSLTREEYDRQRATLEGRQREIRAEYASIQQLIARYESKRSELAAINSESEVLNRSINSSVPPAPESDSIDG